MKQIFLRRIAMSDKGTFGALVEDKVPFAVTLEPPDKNNQKDISCIPEGSYLCKRVNSPKYGDTFEIMSVDDRDNILFHWGNWLKNTLGCVLTGEEFKEIMGKPAIAMSKTAFKRFMRNMKGINEFALTVQNSYLYGGI